MPTSNIDHAALPIKILVGLFLFKKANLNFLYPKELNSAHYSHENEDLKKALKLLKNVLDFQNPKKVDNLKPSFGNTNDCNTARTFFNDPRRTSDITGLDFLILKIAQNLLAVISSATLFKNRFSKFLPLFYAFCSHLTRVGIRSVHFIRSFVNKFRSFSFQKNFHFKIFKKNFYRRKSDVIY